MSQEWGAEIKKLFDDAGLERTSDTDSVAWTSVTLPRWWQVRRRWRLRRYLRWRNRYGYQIIKVGQSFPRTPPTGPRSWEQRDEEPPTISHYGDDI